MKQITQNSGKKITVNRKKSHLESLPLNEAPFMSLHRWSGRWVPTCRRNLFPLSSGQDHLLLFSSRFTGYFDNGVIYSRKSSCLIVGSADVGALSFRCVHLCTSWLSIGHCIQKQKKRKLWVLPHDSSRVLHSPLSHLSLQTLNFVQFFRKPYFDSLSITHQWMHKLYIIY